MKPHHRRGVITECCWQRVTSRTWHLLCPVTAAINPASHLSCAEPASPCASQTVLEVKVHCHMRSHQKAVDSLAQPSGNSLLLRDPFFKIPTEKCQGQILTLEALKNIARDQWESWFTSCPRWQHPVTYKNKIQYNKLSTKSKSNMQAIVLKGNFCLYLLTLKEADICFCPSMFLAILKRHLCIW